VFIPKHSIHHPKRRLGGANGLIPKVLMTIFHQKCSKLPFTNAKRKIEKRLSLLHFQPYDLILD